MWRRQIRQESEARRELKMFSWCSLVMDSVKPWNWRIPTKWTAIEEASRCILGFCKTQSHQDKEELPRESWKGAARVVEGNEVGRKPGWESVSGKRLMMCLKLLKVTEDECNPRTSSESYLVLTRYWVAFPRWQTKTTSQAAKAQAVEKTFISRYTQNKIRVTPPPMEPKDWDLTGTWTLESFQKWRVSCPGRSK